MEAEIETQNVTEELLGIADVSTKIGAIHPKRVRKYGEEPNGCGQLIRRKNGTVDYVMPTWAKYRAPRSKPFRMTNPQARINDVEATYERVRKSILYESRERIEREKCARHEGKTHRGLGETKYRLTATDGHRAVMKQTYDGIPEKVCFSEARWTEIHFAEFNVFDAEIHNAVRRANVMRGKNNPRIMLEFRSTGNCNGVVTVRSSDPDTGDFEETLNVSLLSMTAESKFMVGINGDWLEEVFGSWPLRMMWNASETGGRAKDALIFAPKYDEWRTVIMPIQG